MAFKNGKACQENVLEWASLNSSLAVVLCVMFVGEAMSLDRDMPADIRMDILHWK